MEDKPFREIDCILKLIIIICYILPLKGTVRPRSPPTNRASQKKIIFQLSIDTSLKIQHGLVMIHMAKRVDHAHNPKTIPR